LARQTATPSFWIVSDNSGQHARHGQCNIPEASAMSIVALTEKAQIVDTCKPVQFCHHDSLVAFQSSPQLSWYLRQKYATFRWYMNITLRLQSSGSIQEQSLLATSETSLVKFDVLSSSAALPRQGCLALADSSDDCLETTRVIVSL